jgi:dTDP-D-glucose 4,6-dehydratase
MIKYFMNIYYECKSQYNIGSDDASEYTVTQVAEMLIEKITRTKDYYRWIKYIEDKPFNDKRYYISNQKVKDLGWSIDIDFDKGIEELIETMKKNIL